MQSGAGFKGVPMSGDHGVDGEHGGPTRALSSFLQSLLHQYRVRRQMRLPEALKTIPRNITLFLLHRSANTPERTSGGTPGEARIKISQEISINENPLSRKNSICTG
jgi:hypothetical protein